MATPQVEIDEHQADKEADKAFEEYVESLPPLKKKPRKKNFTSASLEEAKTSFAELANTLPPFDRKQRRRSKQKFPPADPDADKEFEELANLLPPLEEIKQEVSTDPDVDKEFEDYANSLPPFEPKIRNKRKFASGDRISKDFEEHTNSVELPRKTTTISSTLPTDAMGANVNVNSNAEELDHLLRDLEKEFPQPEPSSRWIKRLEKSDSSWTTNRADIFEEVVSRMGGTYHELCSFCDNEAIIHCQECIPHALCAACDFENHKLQPLHSRWTWWTDNAGYLSSTTFLAESQQGYSPFEAKSILPWSPTHKCRKCDMSQLVAHPYRPLCIINTKGRFDVWSASYTCECGIEVYPTACSYLRDSYWPGCPKQLHTLYEESLFEMVDLVQKFSPGTSTSSFINSLSEMSKQRKRCPSIHHGQFSKAMKEWKFMTTELTRLGRGNDMVCPCCDTRQIAIHVDGNAKLYRYDNTKDQRKSYYGERFICTNQKVRDFVNDLRGEGSLPSTSCGTTNWKAARNIASAKRHLAETGLEIASCRHTIALKSLNMERGEIFAYPLYLQQIFGPKTDYMCGDTICKYWPWYQRKVAADPRLHWQMKPLLSVLHGKAHSWPCQIYWGARWQEGVGLTTGENVEQVNSYLSRFTNTTKYMTAAGREESLTEAAFFWNRRKIDNLAKMLRSWHDKTVQKEHQFLCEYQELCEKYGEQDIQHIKEQLTDFAAEKLRAPAAHRDEPTTLEQKIELAISSVAERKRAITQTADTSKRRHVLRQKLDKDKAVLRSLVDQYNMLHPGANLTEVQVEAEDYPWHRIPEGNELAIKDKRKLAEAHLGIQRSREELIYLTAEMRNYLEFYHLRIKETQHVVANYHNSKDEAEHPPRATLEGCYALNHESEMTEKGAFILAMQLLKFYQQQLQLGKQFFNLTWNCEDLTEYLEELNSEELLHSDSSGEESD